jgi:hypothetical protein
MSLIFLIHGVGWDWVHLVRQPLIGLLYQPGMIDEYEAFLVEWELTKETEIFKKTYSMPLCPPQISHGPTCDRTQAAAVGSRQLTTWTMGSYWTLIAILHCTFCRRWKSFRSSCAVNRTLAIRFIDSSNTVLSCLLGMCALRLLWWCRHLCYSLLYSVVAFGQMVQKVCASSLKNKRTVNNVWTTCVCTIVDLQNSDNKIFVNAKIFAGEARKFPLTSCFLVVRLYISGQRN